MLKAEQETTITYDSEEQVIRIFSARASDQGKLRRAGIAPSKGTKLSGFFYELPLERFRWRILKAVGSRTKRILPKNHPFLRVKTTGTALL